MKKLVSVASRTGRELQRYNLQGCRQVVGCIPYRLRNMEKSVLNSGTANDQLEFLLISSQKSPKWMFPKGGWEIDESMEDAAKRETMEEAGVLGIVENKLGCWTFKSKSQEKFHEGHMLSFKVTEELDVWPEKDLRQRIWVTASEAREKCEDLWMKEALDSFISQVNEPQRKKDFFGLWRKKLDLLVYWKMEDQLLALHLKMGTRSIILITNFCSRDLETVKMLYLSVSWKIKNQLMALRLKMGTRSIILITNFCLHSLRTMKISGL